MTRLRGALACNVRAFDFLAMMTLSSWRYFVASRPHALVTRITYWIARPRVCFATWWNRLLRRSIARQLISAGNDFDIELVSQGDTTQSEEQPS